MSDPIEVAASAWDVMIAEELENTRACTPVHIAVFAPLAVATCEAIPAIPDQLPDGSPSVPPLLSQRPVWYPGGGGYYMRWPLAPDDIALGLVSDRSLAAWSLLRTPGPGAAPTFPHYHNISDLQVLPVTDTPGIPEADPGLATDYVIGGPAGVAIRLEVDGTITITTALATLTIGSDGSILADVPTGLMAKIGDMLAASVVKTAALEAAMTAMLAAGVATAPSPLAGNNGSLAFTAGQAAWNAAINATPLGTTKLMGS